MGILESAASAGAIALALTNPGAETGDITGWTTLLGAPAATPGPSAGGTIPHSGAYHFYGGEAQTRSMMAQTVNIDSALNSDIDADKVTLNLSYFTCQESPDRSCLSVAFLNASDQYVGCWVDNYDSSHAEPTWFLASKAIKLPTGSRKVRVFYDSKRSTGTSNDGFVDDISGAFSVASPTTVELAIRNPEASEGTTGWTATSGSPSVLTSSNGGAVLPRIGTQFFYAGTTATPSMYQTVTVPTSAHTSIDAGAATLGWSYFQQCVGGDQQRLKVEFLASNGTTSLGTSTPAYTANSSTDWTLVSQGPVSIPTGTRYIKISCDWNRVVGTSNDGYCHCFRAWITL